MRTPPSSFSRRLTREFDGRLRIRWSDKKREWHIEQRIKHREIPTERVSEYNDDAIRARDGYAFLMSVRDGSRMACPRCGATVRVYLLATGETTCDRCALKIAAAFFPLEGDALIQYLRRLDPTLGWNRNILESTNKVHQDSLKSKIRAVSNAVEAGTKENWNRLVGISQFGYSGKVHHGTF